MIIITWVRVNKHKKILCFYSTVYSKCIKVYVETISRYLKDINHISLMNEWPNEHKNRENKNIFTIF